MADRVDHEGWRDRIWFWKPQLHWFGWRTLIPFQTGGDEFGYRTIVLGWTVTGRIIIAVQKCFCPECKNARENPDPEWHPHKDL